MADVLANFMACHPRASCQIAGCCHLANLMTCYPGATCHIQGEGVSSAMLKIVFCHILFFVFLMQFGLWHMAAFVSSSIHLLYVTLFSNSLNFCRKIINNVLVRHYCCLYVIYQVCFWNSLAYWLTQYNWVQNWIQILTTLLVKENLHKCISKMHTCQTGAQLKLCVTSQPPFQGQHFCWWLCIYLEPFKS